MRRLNPVTPEVLSSRSRNFSIYSVEISFALVPSNLHIDLPASCDVPIKTIVRSAVSYKQIKLTYQKPFEDFDASTDNPDFPQEWFEALKYGLATRLAGEYGVSMDDRKQLLYEAQSIKAEALGYGTEEGSFFITADYRKY